MRIGRHLLFAMLLVMLLAWSSAYSRAASDSSQIFDHPQIDNLKPGQTNSGNSRQTQTKIENPGSTGEAPLAGQIFDSPKSGRWPGKKPDATPVKTVEKPGIPHAQQVKQTNTVLSTPQPKALLNTHLPAPLSNAPARTVPPAPQPGSEKDTPEPASAPIPLRVVIPPAPPSNTQSDKASDSELPPAPDALPDSLPTAQPKGLPDTPPEQPKPAQFSNLVPPSVREAGRSEAAQTGFSTPDFTPPMKATQGEQPSSMSDLIDGLAKEKAGNATGGQAGTPSGQPGVADGQSGVVGGQPGAAGGQIVPQASIPPAPPIGRGVAPVFSTPPPELAGVGEEDPIEAARREETFNLSQEIGVEASPDTAQERFANAIPGFELPEAEATQTQEPEAFTVNRGPAGQMGE